MNLEFSEKSIEDLKSFSLDEREFIFEKIEYLAKNFEILKNSKKITALKGNHKGKFRFVIARKIRVIFQLKNNNLLILVLRVGRRKDIY